MKLTQCDWAPSLVVEWLTSELEVRGIPGPIYAHTVISLLHDHFCSHLHAPIVPLGSISKVSTCSASEYCVRDSLEDLELSDDLNEFIGGLPHLHVDSYLSANAEKTRGGSRKARKRYRVHRRHHVMSLEHFHKTAALQCLMSASDDHDDLEELVEELCEKLKSAKELESEKLSVTGKVVGRPRFFVVPSSEESENEWEDVSKGSFSAERYSSAFPPLMSNSVDTGLSGTVSKCMADGIMENAEYKSELEETPNATNETYCNELNAFSLTEKSPAEEMLHEKEAERPLSYISIFQGPSLDSDISEGYVGDISSRESSEDRDKIQNHCIDQTASLSNSKVLESVNQDLVKKAVGEERLFSQTNVPASFNKVKSSPIEAIIPNDEDIYILNEKMSAVAQLWGDISKGKSEVSYLWNSLSDHPSERNIDNSYLLSDKWDLTQDIFSYNSTFFNILPDSSKETGNLITEISDFNANNITETMDSLFAKDTCPEELDPKQVCEQLSESLKNLQLSHLWSSDCSGSSENMLNDKENGFLSMSRSLSFENKVNSFSKISLGPCGPQADLGHTESSGFSAVVPKNRKGLDVSESSNIVANNQQKLLFPYEFSNDELSLSFSHEEENLLVSPRTHFRPIHKESLTSNTDSNEDSDNVAYMYSNAEGHTNNLERDENIADQSSKHLSRKENNFSPEEKLFAHSMQVLSKLNTENEKICQTDEACPTNVKDVQEDFSGTTSDLFKLPEKEKAFYQRELPGVKDIAKIWQNEVENEFDMWQRKDDKWSVISTLREKRDDIASIWAIKPPGFPVLPDYAAWSSEKNGMCSIKNIEWSTGENGPKNWSDHKDNTDDNIWSSGKIDSIDCFKPCMSSKDNDDEQMHFNEKEKINDVKNFVPSSFPLHERLSRKLSAELTSEHQENDTNILEDLEQLDPGWEFNEGFEWGLSAQDNEANEEYCSKNVADEEDSAEVLICEADDGSTYTIPVEYIDDNLYDEIFGSMPEIGKDENTYGSKEQEWKKDGISYKLCKSKPGTRWLPARKRPCSFFMDGSCLRSDCRFSHDLSSITCRFWEEGSCLKGECCPFLHGYPVKQRKRNKSEGCKVEVIEPPFGSNFEIDSEMDFPSLGSSLESRAGSMDDKISQICFKNSIKKKKKKLSQSGDLEVQDGLHEGGKAPRRRRRCYTDTEMPASEPKPIPVRRVFCRGHVDGTVSDY